MVEFNAPLAANGVLDSLAVGGGEVVFGTFNPDRTLGSSTMRGRNAARTGDFTDVTPPADLSNEEWVVSASTDGIPTTDTVYMGDGSSVKEVKRTTGGQIQSASLGGNAIGIAALGNYLYVTHSNGMDRINRHDFTVDYSVTFNTSAASQPCPVSGTGQVYVHTDSEVWARNMADGTLAFQYTGANINGYVDGGSEQFNAAYSSGANAVIVCEGDLITTTGSISAVDTTGTQIWSVSFSGTHPSPFCVWNNAGVDEVVGQSGYGSNFRVRSIDAGSGTINTDRNTFNSGIKPAPAVDEANGYALTTEAGGSYQFELINLADGSKVWEAPKSSDSHHQFRCAIVGSVGLVSDGATTYMLNMSDGSVVDSISQRVKSFIADSGRLFAYDGGNVRKYA